MKKTLLNYFGPPVKKARTEKAEDHDLERKDKNEEENEQNNEQPEQYESEDQGPSSSAGCIPPSCWTEEQFNFFCKGHPWLKSRNGQLGCDACGSIGRLGLHHHLQGSRLAKEWLDFKICSSGDTREAQMASLRKKIWQHKGSYGHKTAVEIVKKSKEGNLESSIQRQNAHLEDNTNKIFRTAYMISKNQQPFSLMEDLVDLQEANGITLGGVLQSRKSCGDICEFIGEEMRKRLVTHIIKNDSKMGVLIDESTTASHLTVLIVCLRCAIGSNPPTTVIFELLALTATTAKSITSSLLQCLHQHFPEEFLKRNWISFTSDGASNMIGRVSGVSTQLKHLYPDLIVWHCCNHRLELAVGDTIKDNGEINHFQAFMDKLYSLYHASPKNERELHQNAEELSVIFLTIGRVLGVRWVASSERTLRAVWQLFPALHEHFQRAAQDPRRDGREQNMYKGLAARLTATAFVRNLGVMRDALTELSELSLMLQSNTITLPLAHSLVCQKVKVFEARAKGRQGEFARTASEAEEKSEFQGVPLHPGRMVDVGINAQKFYDSLASSLRKRLMTTSASKMPHGGSSTHVSEYDDILSSCRTIYPRYWPDDYDILYGEAEVVSMCKRLHLPERPAINAFREYKENGGKAVPGDLKPLVTALESVAVSTAECERGFSSMNTTLTPLRSSLGIGRLSSIVFLSRNGPPLAQFEPMSYVKLWLLRGRRSADHLACRKREKGNRKEDKAIWSLF